MKPHEMISQKIFYYGLQWQYAQKKDKERKKM